jgi:hypothetical protein
MAAERRLFENVFLVSLSSPVNVGLEEACGHRANDSENESHI